MQLQPMPTPSGAVPPHVGKWLPPGTSSLRKGRSLMDGCDSTLPGPWLMRDRHFYRHFIGDRISYHKCCLVITNTDSSSCAYAVLNTFTVTSKKVFEAGHLACFATKYSHNMCFPGGSNGKESTCNTGEPGSISE